MKKTILTIAVIAACGLTFANQRVPSPRDPHHGHHTPGPKTPPGPPSTPSTPSAPAPTAPAPIKTGEPHGRPLQGGVDKPCDQPLELQPFWCKVLK